MTATLSPYRMPGEVEEDIEVKSKKMILTIAPREKEKALDHAENYNIIGFVFLGIGVICSAIASGVSMPIPLIILAIGSFVFAGISMYRRKYWREVAAIPEPESKSKYESLTRYDREAIAKEFLELMRREANLS